MQLVLHPAQRKHAPRSYLSAGSLQPHPEQPERIDALQNGAQEAGLELTEPKDCGTGPIAAIHSAEYISFLETIHARWRKIPGSSEEVIPNIHPDSREASYPSSAIGQAGFHQADCSCPISSETWTSAYWSAQSAIAGARRVIGGGSAYALCRPPGHHAFADLAGGFCYFNNSAISAQIFCEAGLRPAIIDVDLHHGNGTQGIFYSRSDVLTVSVHRDTSNYYPHFWGYAHERGAGCGLGMNLNLPLAGGTGDAGFLDALQLGLNRVLSFGAQSLVVALGLDAYAGDPFGGLTVTTEGFARIGGAIAKLSLPTLIVQEGGYLCGGLSQNLTAFLSAFLDCRKNRIQI
ncbi:MAG: histone deacetylase family protein [Albidovulum sp.]|nr:histone deacetylase family protein [Albidovulum sp.]